MIYDNIDFGYNYILDNHIVQVRKHPKYPGMNIIYVYCSTGLCLDTLEVSSNTPRHDLNDSVRGIIKANETC